ncbi:YbaY family lipoprotein [Shewanella acanthi]|uniref:YbaY family lipoprotein n=1 Tax=Shewanella acanthi TaxID=2864212 RepID=UPI001C660AD6|nr:YbaY family lipoprotein [Shewanella acanthi]QYJ77779.1 YbaY family lipoprotein [Shewanella acanthi]
MEQGFSMSEVPSMLTKWSTMVILTLATVVSGCSASNSSTNKELKMTSSLSDSVIEIKGEALYRERILLPNEANLIVQLLDVSRMDVPATVLAEQVNSGAKSPTPFSFKIERDRLVAGHTYAVGARIMLKDKLLFINTQAYHIDQNSTQPMTIVLEKIGR